MNTTLNQEIHVIIREGIVESVLVNTQNEHPGLEIIDINESYEDCADLKSYADQLYHDPKFKEIDFTMYHNAL